MSNAAVFSLWELRRRKYQVNFAALTLILSVENKIEPSHPDGAQIRHQDSRPENDLLHLTFETRTFYSYVLDVPPSCNQD